MNNAIARRQGQPILFLGLLVAGWFLLRILTWESPLAPAPLLAEPMRLASDTAASEGIEAAREAGSSFEDPPFLVRPVPAPWSPPVKPGPERLAAPLPTPLPTPVSPSDAFDTHRRGVGHAMLFAAGMASLPMPKSVARMLDERDGRTGPQPGALARPTPSRWRFDGWVVLREGAAQLTGAGTRPASYGASQLGAVLAYRLAPSGSRDPAAYVRVSEGLIRGGEREAALGVRARPVASLPVSLHLEARVTDRPAGGEVRAAAFVAGGFENTRLPAGLRARGYGQAGYVHGEFATPFADGKLVAEREVARFDLGTASLGVGAWGGAQKGAHRVDLGPTVSFDLRLGETPARLEADYRWRLAGNAEPGSGGVLTLSTGF